MRLFVAISLGETIERRAREAMERLKGLAPRARWVPPANLHLTLSFLGEVGAERVPALSDALMRVAERHAPLTLAIRGGGGFGAPSHPRVLWADVGGDTEALKELQADVARAMKEMGFELEERAYTAHLTLARARAPRGDRELAGCVRALQDEDWGEARVDRLLLFESSKGQYLPRAEAPLRQSPPEPG
jgi:RNA 2',3'-cyclic 3'-phosphodiesterase